MVTAKEQSRNRFSISDGIGNRRVIPFWQVFVEFDGHVLLEVFGVFATDFIDFVHDPHDHIQARRCFRFFDVVFFCFNRFQRDAFAGSVVPSLCELLLKNARPLV